MSFVSKHHEIINDGKGSDSVKKTLINLRMEDIPSLLKGDLFWPCKTRSSSCKEIHRDLIDPTSYISVIKAHGEDWDRKTSWDGLMKLIKEGWAEGAVKALKLAKEISNADMSKLDNISVKRRRVRSSQGDYLNMEKVYAGRLEEAWTTFMRNRAIKSRRISLVCGWGGNCGRTADQMFWTGAVALALTHLWEKAGYRVAIKALGCCEWHSDNSISGQMLEVKKHGQPVNPGFLATMLCHSAAFRKVCFLAKTQSTTSVINDGLGYPMAPHTLDITQSRFIDPQSIVLDKVYSKESAMEALASNLTFMVDGAEGYQG